jgi:M6 family metalloprotease-like protein
MTMTLTRFACVLVIGSSSALFAADRESLPAPAATIDLTGYRTTKDALKADPTKFKLDATPTTAKKPGFLGVSLGSTATGVAVVDDVEPDSPAEACGLTKGDLIRSIAGQPARTAAAVRELLRGRYAGDSLAVVIERNGSEKTLTAVLKPISKPFDAAAPRATIGVIAGEPNEKGGVDLARVTTGGAAAKAGIKNGDVLLSIENQPVTGQNRLAAVMSAYRPGETVLVRYRRGEKEDEVKIVLAADDAGAGFGGRGGNRGWDDRLPRAWTRPNYKLAVIGVEYADQKHNDKIKDKDWDASLFSRNSYFDKSATGQRVYGSMNDYYHEISYGKFQVDGKFVGWVELPKKRMEYSTGSGTSNAEKTKYFTEVLDKFLAKNGKDALKDYDGIFFVFAGSRVGTTRGSLYWPHRSTFRHNGKSWPYFIVQEGGERMTDISVFCHEFGHMLGLPDLYARPEEPGMEGVGVWCAMSQQNPQGRPQHFSAWCKEQLGWIKPVLIDPTVKQKLILSPVITGTSEYYKIPIRQDGSEYLLLENRKKQGFDSELPAEGLLIWRVIPGNRQQKVYLEEAHGVEGSSGPRMFPGAVPFPSPANNSFTPQTTPSSRSLLGGGYDVYITNVKRLPDGRIAFQIGYEYQ